MSDDQLSQFRQSIDNIDAALIHMLAERFRITQAVGEYKAEAGMPPADPTREQEQIKRLRKLAEDAGLDPEFSEKFLRFVIARSDMSPKLPIGVATIFTPKFISLILILNLFWIILVIFLFLT